MKEKKVLILPKDTFCHWEVIRIEVKGGNGVAQLDRCLGSLKIQYVGFNKQMIGVRVQGGGQRGKVEGKEE